MSKPLQGEIALVTGAARRIGAAVVAMQASTSVRLSSRPLSLCRWRVLNTTAA